jgi:hypothetical protein
MGLEAAGFAQPRQAVALEPVKGVEGDPGLLRRQHRDRRKLALRAVGSCDPPGVERH